MKKSLQHLFCILSALLVLAGCVDVLVDEPKAPILSDEAEEFWHTRTLSKASRLELKRKYGIGFSYDAVYGGKCFGLFDAGFVLGIVFHPKKKILTDRLPKKAPLYYFLRVFAYIRIENGYRGAER